MDVKRNSLQSEIGLYLAISSQLFTTRITETVGQLNFTYTQFTILNHLAATDHATVSDLAEAMEIKQPGVSKVVAKLANTGALKVSPDANDSRRRLITITKHGRAKLAEANELLATDGQRWFTEWPTPDLEDFRNHLAALTTWLDQNRLQQ